MTAALDSRQRRIRLRLTPLLQLLGNAGAHQLREAARAIRSAHRCAFDEVGAWRVLVAVDRELRSRRRTTMAATAARQVAAAVVTAARVCEVDPADPDVVCLARAGRDLARAQVSGGRAGAAAVAKAQKWLQAFAPVAA